MGIAAILRENQTTISCELFPPKADSPLDLDTILRETAALRPAFVSVTCGAGGSTNRNTLSIAAQLQNTYHTPALAHLTCVASTRAQTEQAVAALRQAGIHSLLALRGDMPKEDPVCSDYRHASQLISHIRSLPGGDGLSIGGACYPEGHIESPSPEKDLDYLKEKVDCGADFLTTQMFFDNDALYRFLDTARAKGICVPIAAGIMPITNAKQIKRSCELSGCSLTPRLLALTDRFGDDPAAMRQAGIDYAVEQIGQLMDHGVTHIHIYTMNRPDVAARIMGGLSGVLPAHAGA